MAWTAPRTWAVGEVVTASHLNTHVRDNLLALPHPLDNANTTLEIVNNATDQAFYSYAIPANALGANGYVTSEIIGDVLTNNTSTSGQFNLALRYGPPGGPYTPIFSQQGEYSDDPGRRTFRSQFFLINRGATNSQILRWEPGFPQVTLGSIVSAQAETAIDTTTTLEIYFFWQWTTADSNNSLRRLWARTLLAS